VHFVLKAKTVFSPRFFACGAFSTFLYGNGSHSKRVTVTPDRGYVYIHYRRPQTRAHTHRCAEGDEAYHGVWGHHAERHDERVLERLQLILVEAQIDDKQKNGADRLVLRQLIGGAGGYVTIWLCDLLGLPLIGQGEGYVNITS
jgi:hypothetical protein